MSDLDGLRRQLTALVEVAATRQAEERTTRAKEMQQFDTRHGRFEQVAGAWTSEFVTPRLRALADALPGHGEVEPVRGGRGARVTFGWSEEFPIAASLTVSIVPDVTCEHACVLVEPRLIPMLAGHPSAASQQFDIESAEPPTLGRFLDQEMLAFAGHHLRVREAGSLYQRHALVTDPVCGMTIRPSDAVETYDHDGRHYHFCSASCAVRFRQDPEGCLRASQAIRGGV